MIEERQPPCSEQFMAALQHAPLSLFNQDLELRYTWVYNSLFGISTADLLGRTDTELFSAADAAGITAIKQRSLHEGATVRNDLKINYHGRELYCDITVTPLRDAVGAVIGITGSLADMTTFRQSEREMRITQERQKLLSRSLLEKLEAERRHIARELHDEIGQALTAIKINLQSIQRLSRATSITPPLEAGIGIVERALLQVRTMSLNLRPSLLDDLGLAAALRWCVDRMAQPAGLAVQFSCEALSPRPHIDIETACFRIAQEAFTNIVKHARARRITVELTREAGALHLRVHDDGSGFDPLAARQLAVKGGSFGLLGMEERATLVGGSITLSSGPGQGTELRATFPLTGELP